MSLRTSPRRGLRTASLLVWGIGCAAPRTPPAPTIARPNPALVRVYHGSPDGLARPEDLDLTSERSIVGADVRVASLGDVDGHADVVLGANCVETDADTGDSCLRREHYLLRGGADGVSPSRMQPVPE